MKYITLTIFFFTSLLSCFASVPDKWDDVEIRDYPVESFRYVHLEGGFKVVLQQADKPGLSIKADEDDFDYLDVTVHDEVLDIEIKDKHFTLDQIILYIRFTNIEKLHIEGGVKLNTQGYVELNDFYVHVEGGAKINMNVKANHLKAIGEGGVSFHFEGVCQSFEAKASGASYINAEDLKSERVKIQIDGVGAGYVYATDFLDATIQGVGKINYKGNPKVHKNIGGLGFVTQD